MGNSPLPSREGQGVGLIKAQDAAPSRILQFMFLYVLVPSLTGGALWLLRGLLPPRVARRGALWLLRGFLPPRVARRGAFFPTGVLPPTGGVREGPGGQGARGLTAQPVRARRR